MELTFTLLSENDLPELEEWYKDPELRKRYGSEHWPRNVLKIMQKDTNRCCWVVQKEEKMIGYVDFEILPEENLGWIGLVVNPTLRNQTYGRRILASFLNNLRAGHYNMTLYCNTRSMRTPDVYRIKEVRAGIEADNIASLKCFRAAGFVQMNAEPDHEGIFDFSYKV